ncbi:MAG: alpha/beta fold hydrolase [Pseudomonadota bacterium]
MILRFAECCLDTRRLELRRRGDVVRVEPQVFDVLVKLARGHGEVVSRDVLVETVWKGLIVSEATISARISAARAAVGDDGKRQQIIRTVPRRGFAMVPEVHEDAGTEHAPLDPGSRSPSAPGLGGQEAGLRFASSADGLPIAWHMSGRGKPLLRAGHWLSHLDLDPDSPVWGPLLRAFAGRHTLIRYDQRGTGRSGRRIGNGDLDDFVLDMLAVADAAGLERFDIFAASQAVPVALRFAARHPDRVSRMALIGGYAVGRALRETDDLAVDEETMLSLIRKGWGRQGSAFVRAMASLFMPGATSEQVDDFVRIQLASATPENAVALRRSIDRFDVLADLPKVQAPVLLLHAENDSIQPLEQAQILASRLPHARLHLLQSSNHVMLPQDPAWHETLAAIEDFLAEGS